MALPGAGQQDIGRQAAVIADAPIFQSGGCASPVGGHHDRPKRHGLGAFYRRLSSRIGKQKAVTATARKIAVLFYNTVRYGMIYRDPGAAAYDERHRQRVLANLQRRAKTLGFALAPMPDAEAVS